MSTGQFERVKQVRDLMDTNRISYGDLRALSVLEAIYDNNSPEHFEPVLGDMVFEGSLAEAWESVPNVDDIEIWSDAYDAVYDALVEAKILTRFEYDGA